MEVQELPSEKCDRLGIHAAAAKPLYQCDMCGMLFSEETTSNNTKKHDASRLHTNHNMNSHNQNDGDDEEMRMLL